MKRVITTIFAILFFAMGSSALQAQNIDRSRMNRDLSIMKGILNELFKSTWNDTEKSKVTTFSYSYHSVINLNNTGKITATYIPGYGVLFNINGTRNPVIFLTNTNAKAYFIHSGGNGKSKTPITKQSVVNRIKEFMENYGASIHQLKNNDRVTVVFKGSSRNSDKAKLPSVAVSATMGDLKTYRRGDLSKQELSDRLSISDLKQSAPDDQWLKIFAGILKSALSGSNDNDFELNNITYFRLKGIGAFFEGEVLNGWNTLSGMNVAYFNFKNGKLTKNIRNLIHFDSLQTHFDSMQVHFDSNRVNLKMFRIKPHQINAFNKKIDSIQQRSRKDKQKLQNALDNFITMLKKTVLDYGNTLKSLQPDESIIISLSVSGVGDDLPNHLYLQVKRSTLAAYAKGSATREQALERIQVSKN